MTAQLKIVKTFAPRALTSAVAPPTTTHPIPVAPPGYYYGGDGNLYKGTGVPQGSTPAVVPAAGKANPATTKFNANLPTWAKIDTGDNFKATESNPNLPGSAANVGGQIASQPGVLHTASPLATALVAAGAFFIPGIGWPLGVAETYKLYGHSAFGDPTTLKGALTDLSYLPFYRGPRAAVRFIKALSAGDDLEKAFRAAGASLKEAGPLAAAFHHKLSTGSWTKAGAAGNDHAAPPPGAQPSNTVAAGSVQPGDIQQPTAAGVRHSFNEPTQWGTEPPVQIGQIATPDLTAPSKIGSIIKPVFNGLDAMGAYINKPFDHVDSILERRFPTVEPPVVAAIGNVEKLHPELVPYTENILHRINSGDLVGAHEDITSLLHSGTITPGGRDAIVAAAKTIEDTNAAGVSFWNRLKSETGTLVPGAGPGGNIPAEHQAQLFDTPEVKKALLPENNGLGTTDHPVVLTKVRATAIAKQIRAAGHNLPPSMNTLPKLTKAIQRLHATAIQGHAYRDWYARAAANAQEVSNVTGLPVKEVTQLMAVYSQVRNPTENMGLVLKAIKEYQDKGVITETLGGGEGSGRFQQQKANAILSGSGWQGRKTNTYFQNMGEHIPELHSEVTNPGGVTVDRHATNLVAPELKGSPGPHYSGIEHTYQEVAHELGWSPQEVQAASWVVFKADLNMARHPTWSRARALRDAGDAYEAGVKKHLHGIGKQQAIDSESVDKINANIQTAADILRETDYSGLEQGIHDIHNGTGGHIWTANLASDTATGGYFVSNGKAEITVPQAEATADKVRAYRDTHADALAADPTLRVGAWGTVRDGQQVVVLDLTHHINDRLSALKIGMKAGQEAVWDVKNGVEIPVRSRSMHEHNPGGAYEQMLHDNAVRQGWQKPGKPITKINRTASEAQLHEWANSNPDHPASSQFHDLYLRAHAAGQADLGAALPRTAADVATGETVPVRKSGLAHKLADETGSLNLGELLRKEVRSPAEAQDHIKSEAQKALDEGYGEHTEPATTPEVTKGETTDQTGGEIGAQVRQALQGGPNKGTTGSARGAKSIRKEQDILYSEARTERAKAAEAHLQAGNYEAAMKELKGALPKVDFQGFKQFDETTVKAMEAHIMEHPYLRPYEKINSIQSVRDALTGKVPTRSQQKLLEKVFGRNVTDQVVESSTVIHKWSKRFVNVLNVPRSLMASMDLSAPFRQGLMVSVSHPIIFGKAFAPMVRAARRESNFQHLIQDEIHNRPTYPLMEKAKVAFTDIGGDAHGPEAMSAREEQFMSNYAERIPGIGHVVRGSDRAYVGFLNKVRADVFDHLLNRAAAQGLNVGDRHFLESLGRFVNSSTGRGNLGKLNDHTATLNALFFAPRLLASRINFLNPLYYAKLDPFVRREALKAFIGLGVTASTILSIAHTGGAKVNLDPTNADFAKIKVGNARVDILGGFQQPVRLAAQLAEGKLTSSTTGQAFPLGSGFGKTSRYDVAMKFLQGKLSPVPSLVVDALKGKDFTGNVVAWDQLSSVEREIASRMIPFLAQDLYSIQTTSGTKAAVGLGALDLIGVGVQDYKGGIKQATLTSAAQKLTRDSQKAGLGKPPADVLSDLNWYVQLQHAVSQSAASDGTTDYIKAAQATAKLYDQRYADPSVISQAADLTTQGEAQKFYEILGPQLYPSYRQWKTITDHRLSIIKAQQGSLP